MTSTSAPADDLRVDEHVLKNGGRWWDFGIEAEGGIEAGLILSQICTSNLAQIDLVPGRIGDQTWPHIQVSTDHPTEACLFSQYAGWKVSVGKFFGLGSGPIRAIAAREDVFKKLDYREHSQYAVGILETDQPPDEAVFAEFASKTGIENSRKSQF